MGSAGSTLTKLESVEVTRVMKNEYEKCLAAGMAEAEIQEKMLAIYNTTLERVKENPLKLITTHRKLQRGISKDVPVTNKAFKDVKYKKSSSLRRRSFDKEKSVSVDKPPLTPQKEESPPPPLAPGPPTPETAAPEEVIGDSWESVREQPSCVICGMVFATISKLDRHVKYSLLHEKNLNRLTSDGTDTASKVPVAPAEFEEDARCRALYTGSKFFWRSKDTFDLHIYLHIEPRCIEVIPFNYTTNKDAPRIYFSETSLLKCIGNDRIQQVKQERIELYMAEQEESEVLPPDDFLLDEAKRLAISSYLLSRLQLDTENDTKILKFEASGADDATVNPVLPAKPDDVKAVSVVRRRRSTGEEVETKLKAISEIQKAVDDLATNAENIEKIVSANFTDELPPAQETTAEVPRKTLRKSFSEVHIDGEPVLPDETYENPNKLLDSHIHKSSSASSIPVVKADSAVKVTEGETEQTPVTENSDNNKE